MPVDHYENFPVASYLMPARLRPAVEAIYRFARSADDLADEGEAPAAERLAALARYRATLHATARGQAPPPALAPVFLPLGQALQAHRLPVSLLEDLLDAFSQDVVKTRYTDFDDLLDYCRRSANPVGRLLLHLYGHTDPQSLARSDAICTSLQLINFWQDVAIDWQKDRIYLPADSRAHFGVDEAQIGAGRCDRAWRALLAHEVGRARRLMRDGAPLAQTLPGRLGWELRLVVLGGLRILERIEAVDYDVFRRRPALARRDWLLLAWRAPFFKRVA